MDLWATTWIERNVGADIRVCGVMAAQVIVGTCALTYRVEQTGHADHGPYVTFKAAVKAARRLNEIDLPDLFLREPRPLLV